MTRKRNKDDWRKKRRQEYLETREYRYYIFTEGIQTEPLYFQHFKDLIEENPIYKDMVLVKLEPCGAETERVVDQARKYVRDNRITKGQIWCVYDKDSFPAAHFNNAALRLEQYNEDSKLRISVLIWLKNQINDLLCSQDSWHNILEKNADAAKISRRLLQCSMRESNIWIS